jgi:hypothetical protein
LKEVYMEIPPGLETSSNYNKVCKLKKLLYGLKQSPRAWFADSQRQWSRMGILSAKQTTPCLSNLLQKIKRQILIVYVDDIMLIGDYGDELVKLKILLANLRSKTLGTSDTFLAWKWHDQGKVYMFLK